MNLVISGDRACTLGSAPLSVLQFKRQMEGRTNLNKDGSFSFVPTQHNLSLWLLNFPDSLIDDQREVTALFGSVDNQRPEFILKRKPLDHQQKAFDKLKQNNIFGLFYDPGAGKSKSLTDLATYHYCQGNIDAVIIWTPNELVSEQWARRNEKDSEGQLERDIHESIPWSVWLWSKNKTKKSKQMYEDLKSFAGLQILVMNIDAGKTEYGENLMKDFINFHHGRVLFAIDESHLIKTKTSGRAKAAFHFGGMVSSRAILTGTPIGKDLLDLWSQFLFLDEKIIGIRYKTAFMNSYCVTRWNGFAQEVVGHKNVDKLYERIDPFIYRVTQKELGLEKMFDEFEFSMYDEQKEHYNNLKKLFITQLDNGEFLTSANAISAMTRMQQVSNGYLVREDGTFQELPNARLDAFKNWIETISDEKLVIWCRFKNDAKLLCNHLGQDAVDISGNVESSGRIDNKNRFINSKEIRYAVGTPDAAGTGMDGMQDVCNRALRYSLSYNLILFDQAENRTSRIGGNGTAFYTDLIGKGTLDRKILRNLSGKKDLSSLTLDDIRMMINE